MELKQYVKLPHSAGVVPALLAAGMLALAGAAGCEEEAEVEVDSAATESELETETQQAGDDLDRAAESTGEALETLGDRTGEALREGKQRTGEALEQAGQNLQRNSDPEPVEPPAGEPDVE